MVSTTYKNGELGDWFIVVLPTLANFVGMFVLAFPELR